MLYDYLRGHVGHHLHCGRSFTQGKEAQEIMAGPRHRQASKTWRNHNRSKGGPKRAHVQEHWKALNTDTGELCPHFHHSEKSARSCGQAHWENYRPVKIRDMDGVI